MQNPAFNFRHLWRAIPVPLKLTASGLLLALLGIQMAGATTQPANRPSVAQAQRVAQADVAKRLVGLWQAPTRPGAPPLRLVFGGDGKMYIILPAASGQAQALDLRYRINAASRPMQLDIIAEGNRSAPTIFELTPDRKLRLQLQGINAGRPRPTAFGANATVLEKVSDAANLPANTRVVQPGGNTPLPGGR
ncbi:MAG TPA: hypothetical protein DDW76_24715 [Cyanobacteria bacterium UBA11369]|nr:hypothetical protein [Cyanobacteria bacterium UBA11371]HBE35784.1 hypothetical protein [Cyanobacteria bacterium UBA11368]HBE51888.1 hypothetical protein [Cyanobacteria bacterium UBA11369]